METSTVGRRTSERKGASASRRRTSVLPSSGHSHNATGARSASNGTTIQLTTIGTVSSNLHSQPPPSRGAFHAARSKFQILINTANSNRSPENTELSQATQATQGSVISDTTQVDEVEVSLHIPKPPFEDAELIY